MHVAVKVLIGLILIIIGLALFVLSPTGIDWINNFVILVTGVIPIFLIIVGLFVVWLELDELKAQRELAKEEVKEEPKETKK